VRWSVAQNVTEFVLLKFYTYMCISTTNLQDYFNWG